VYTCHVQSSGFVAAFNVLIGYRTVPQPDAVAFSTGAARRCSDAAALQRSGI
jgi:hypothetical protein